MVEDARQRTVRYIEAYDTPANITKNNDATQARIIKTYENPRYPLTRVVFDPKNVDGIITVGTPTSEALYDWKKEPYAYRETVPIYLDAFTKQGITADLLRWKMEQDIRNITELYPMLGATGYGSSVRLLNRMVPISRPFGLLKCSSVRYDLEYKRSDDNYASDVTLSYGTGYYNDGSTLGSEATGTASGGTNATLIDATLTEADDYWNKAILQMRSGSLAGGQRPITDFDQGSFTLTFAPIFGAAVVNTDTYRITSVGQVEDGNTVTTTAGSFFTLTVTATAGNFAAYISLPAENAVSNLDLDSAIYTKIRWRYKTTGTNKAKIVLVFSTWDYADSAAVNIAAGKGQEVLADSSSSTWTVGSATITTGKTIDHIRLHADHGAGADCVYYDWVTIYKGDFTFPNVLNNPFDTTTRNVDLGIPSSIGIGWQNLGAAGSTFDIECDLDMETATYDWTRAGDTDKDEVFRDIIHNHSFEYGVWQWLVFGNKSMRVQLDSVRTDPREGKLYLTGHEYSDSNMNGTYNERWGM